MNSLEYKRRDIVRRGISTIWGLWVRFVRVEGCTAEAVGLTSRANVCFVVLTLGARLGEKDAFLSYEMLQHVNQLRLLVQGWSRERGLVILALRFLSKPQLSKFQTPRRKLMLTHHKSYCLHMFQADCYGSQELSRNLVIMGGKVGDGHRTQDLQKNNSSHTWSCIAGTAALWRLGQEDCDMWASKTIALPVLLC